MQSLQKVAKGICSFIACYSMHREYLAFQHIAQWRGKVV